VLKNVCALSAGGGVLVEARDCARRDGDPPMMISAAMRRLDFIFIMEVIFG
jgi:hypothetical protein